MEPDRYRALMARFDALCDATPETRAAAMAELEVDDPALAEALRLMLAADRAPVEPMAIAPDPGPPIDPMVGRLLDGRYRVDGVQGHGGMATVYRGEQVNVGRVIAIKVLHDHLQRHDGVIRRFEREARIIAELRHPNTLKLIDFGRTPSGAPYIITPMLDGRPLDRVLDDGPLGAERTLRMLRQITGALAEAHGRGIVHRDLKPGNIFLESVGSEDVFTVLDFGVAQWRSGTEHETATGRLLGTPAYMSPEQIEAEGPLDGRSDIYSLGVMTFACLTGALPWANINSANMAIKHLTEPPRRFADIGHIDAAPAHVEALVRWMLRKPVDARPRDVDALRAALDAIAAGTWAGPPPDADDDVQPVELSGASLAPGAAAIPSRRFGSIVAVVGIIGALGLAAWALVPAPDVVEPPPSPAPGIVSTDRAPDAPASALPVTADTSDSAPPADIGVSDSAPIADPDAAPTAHRPDDAALPPARRAPSPAAAKADSRPPKATAVDSPAARPTREASSPPTPRPDYVPAPGLY